MIEFCATAANGATPASQGQLFAPPAARKPQSEILLLSTRPVGISCDPDRLQKELACKRYEIDQYGSMRWNKLDWHHVLDLASFSRTVVYVHGNRVEPGEDIFRGMKVYRSLMAARRPGQSIRFIIWSWPSTTIAGPMKDVHLKAARTRPAGWQLAWFLDQLPADNTVSLVGYSFGARVVSGSLHLLGGGQLSGLRLEQRVHPDRPRFRVSLLAAAYDADWLQPGHYHGRSLSQIEKLVLVTNHRDPAMRLYHFSVDRGRIHALGKNGIARPSTVGSANRRIDRIDVTSEVGRSHTLSDYLAASGKMRSMWQRVIPREDESAVSSEPKSVERRL